MKPLIEFFTSMEIWSQFWNQAVSRNFSFYSEFSWVVGFEKSLVFLSSECAGCAGLSSLKDYFAGSLLLAAFLLCMAAIVVVSLLKEDMNQQGLKLEEKAMMPAIIILGLVVLCLLILIAIILFIDPLQRPHPLPEPIRPSPPLDMKTYHFTDLLLTIIATIMAIISIIFLWKNNTFRGKIFAIACAVVLAIGLLFMFQLV